MAMMNPPFLNGSSAPVRLRVPSGKIRNELPSRSASAAFSIAGRLCSGLPRWSGTNPAEVERLHEHRQLPQLRLVDDPQAREELAQDA